MLRPEVLQRLTICMPSDQGILGIPSDPDSKSQKKLAGVIESQCGKTGGKRTDDSFIILKLLIHQWLTSGEPVTADWLA